MKNFLRRRGKLPAAIGLILIAVSLFMLLGFDDHSQYIIRAPYEPEGGKSGALSMLLKAWETAREELSDMNTAITAVKYNEYVSSDSGTGANAGLFSVDGGFRSIHPRYFLEGRWFSESELQEGAACAVLDETLAFYLFSSESAEGKSVSIEGSEYRVIGVVRHKKAAGDYHECGAYIPLNRAMQSGVGADYVIAEADTQGNNGRVRAFRSAAETALGNGEMYDLHKEMLRFTMSLRWMALLFGTYLVLFLIRCVNALGKKSFLCIRESLKTRYAIRVLPEIALRTVMIVFLYALLIFAFTRMLSVVVNLMEIFTEWVPDVFVEAESYEERISALLHTNADPEMLQTSEAAGMRVYGACLRWGVIMLIAGAFLMRGGKTRSEQNTEKA